ncbi:MAG: hypothetical protein JWP42_3163 [Pseudomonas sp.]|nr:hypothetical protein [Pseudomonas sp.]
MTDTALPYFFDEAERASNKKQPGEREKQLTFTLADLKWLKVVYLATDSARTAHETPMHVKKLFLTPDVPLAGAFAMCRPDDGEVTLYTPWKGLVKFADMTDLESQLKEWLAQDTGKRELLRFLAIEQRHAFSAATAALTTKNIDAGVFKAQELTLEDNQTRNIKAMIGELVKMPTLQAMLDQTLDIALRKSFPELDQSLTQLKSYVGTGSAASKDPHTVSSISLSEALLHYYLNNQWPSADSRVFSNPTHGVSSDTDNAIWESTLKEVAHSLTPRLEALIDTFWNTAMSNGMPRSTLFIEGMRDTFHNRILLQRQQGVLTTQEYLRLMNVSLAPVAADSLRIEKVRISAPFKHYLEPASTLMIGSHDTLGFLYTQSRGVEATSDLPAVRNIVLQMLNSTGHEDTLLNYMSLDERRTFLSLPANERTLTGVPINTPVFEQLMSDIRDKQLQNLAHGLDRYRESEGTLDARALLDNALDVRGLIDDRLLTADSGDRWKTRTDQRWTAQPATVRAETAKDQLTLLTTVEQALETQIESHPAIPASIGTVEKAQQHVDASLVLLQAKLSHVFATALRSELKLRTADRTLGTTEQAIIRTVLDGPVKLKRVILNGFLPDVFSLALNAGDSKALLKLASCFVITERGGLDLNLSGKAILWTAASGFEPFLTLGTLRTELERRLQDVDERSGLLENLGRGDRSTRHAYTLAPLQRVNEHFIDELVKPFAQLDTSHVTPALATTVPVSTLTRLLDLAALRAPETGLHRAKNIADSLTFEQKLPTWLAKAPIKDQMLHAELLQQYLNNVSNDQDYLTGIRSLARTAHLQLDKQLKADGFNLDPDKVRIISRRMSETNTQTLTQFALNHLLDLDNIRFQLESLDTTVIPDGVDESYIRDLVKNLNLGQHQQKTLSAAFATTDTQATHRWKRFAAQLPWQLMFHAHTEKLQERLSETAFDLVRQIMHMPDATARAAIDGADAIIRPLELAGLKKDQTLQVPGMYLIGKKSGAAGSQILIAPYSPKHGVKAYEDESRLLTELKSQGGLRDWVLKRLTAPDRALCKTQLTSTNDKITLASSPVSGNLFKTLFDDNAALLARLLGCQSDENAQDEWATIKQVLGEDLNQAYTFFTGKLAYPVTVWRSYLDFKHSADALQSHQWGAAIKGFLSGLAQLAALRQSLQAKPTSSSTVDEPTPETTDSRFKWQDVDITAPERTSLKRHEAIDIDLGALTLDAAEGLYTDPASKKSYGAVEGNVYPVEKQGARWRIVGDKPTGRYIRRNVAKQWVMDPEIEPKFGLLKRLDAAYSVWSGMNVEADGMAEIRTLFPVKHRLIEQALDQATNYVWTAVRNLQVLKTPGGPITPVHRLIMDFIDVPSVLPAHVASLEKVVNEIFSALLDPTLRKPKSRRFATGKVLEQGSSTFGFIVPSDEKRVIYLAEKFFFPNFDHYRNYLTDASFPIREHARAAILIHEISHIACNTEDIAYMDSGRPFYDLIESNTSRAQSLKKALTDIQRKALSSLTPLPELFTIFNPDTGLWEDLGETTNDQTDRARAHVLKLSGEKTLADARRRFKQDAKTRLAVQLGNADSVTWLITRLGRELHTSTP